MSLPRKHVMRALLAVGVLSLSVQRPCLAATFNLRADVSSITMPDGRVVPVWGFALGAGPVTVPGPRLVLGPGDTTLTINLTNNLAVPVSIVVPGLVPSTPMVPVYDAGSPRRVVSFTQEALPGGGTRTYTYTGVRPGSFRYESGTDPSREVQMGLYGALIARPTTAGTAYADASSAFGNEIVMVLSEIDPLFHDTVAAGCYFPEGSPPASCSGDANGDGTPETYVPITSTNGYKPRYYLINGRPYSDPYVPFPGGAPGTTSLIRLINSGLQTHTMTLQGTRMDVIGQDGNFLTFPRKDRIAEAIPAGQTQDILIRPPVAGKYAFFDRGLAVSNAGAFPGGLIAFIEVSGTPNQAPNGDINTPVGNVSISAGQSVNFTGTGTDPDGNAPLAYLWDFGGGPANRTVEDPGNVVFAAAGIFNVTFTVTDSLGLSDPTPATRVITVSAAGGCPGTFETRVSASTDDAEESSTGSVSLTSSDLELVFDSSLQTVGVRFTGLAIPAGAPITTAYIQFYTDEVQSEATNLTIRGQKALNATTFTSTSGNVSSRTSTTASVAWSNLPPWSLIGEAGANQKTPELKSIVQEIVNQAGWAGGNAMAFVIRGTGHRTAVAFNGIPAQAPVLHVEFGCPGGGNQAPNGTIDTPPGGNTIITAGQSVNFTGTGVDPDSNVPLTFSWNFGGGAANSTVEDPGNVVFATPGTYTVTFTVRDSLGLADPTPDSRVVTVNPTAVTVFERRVLIATDDAEEAAGGTVSLGSSDLELVFDTSIQTVGIRFSAVNIPPNAVIQRAFVQFTADETQSEATNLTIRGQAIDDAPTFTSAAFGISSRIPTAASVPWNAIPAWAAVGEAGLNQRTPDLKTVIQQIVNRPGWSSGNALVVVVTGTGHRTAVAYNGIPAQAPLLHVEY